jgi:hypothetical protein
MSKAFPGNIPTQFAESIGLGGAEFGVGEFLDRLTRQSPIASLSIVGRMPHGAGPRMLSEPGSDGRQPRGR